MEDAKRAINAGELYVWLDLVSIPQRNSKSQQAAIVSLPYYAQMSHSMLVLAPSALHVKTREECNLRTYSQRGWCRVECFAKLVHGPEGIFLADERLLHPGGALVPLAATVDHSKMPSTRASPHVSPNVSPEAGRRRGRDRHSHDPRAGGRMKQVSRVFSSQSFVTAIESLRAVTGRTSASRASVSSQSTWEVESGLGAGLIPHVHMRFAPVLGAQVDVLAQRMAGLDAQQNPITRAPSLAETQLMDEMLFVLEGNFTCCQRGHYVDGFPIPCDKDRLKDVIIKIYGSVLVAHKRDPTPMRAAIVAQGDRIIPSSVFSPEEMEAINTVCLGRNRLSRTRATLRASPTESGRRGLQLPSATLSRGTQPEPRAAWCPKCSSNTSLSHREREQSWAVRTSSSGVEASGMAKSHNAQVTPISSAGVSALPLAFGGRGGSMGMRTERDDHPTHE
mmetsp:Transcript_10785/g.29261  ORF Transcript_10785/g.29261 Transcript_10785/m.29261 type:complete len:449 (+) Transcript_10785:1148-2494(+)